MAETEAFGWGIYRVIFLEGITGRQHSPDRLPLVDFKYCFRHTPGEDFERNHVLETDPMGKHLRQILQILNPASIVDQMGEPLKID